MPIRSCCTPQEACARRSTRSRYLTISPAAPVGRNLYGMLVAQGRADLFLTYCTNATAAVRQNPDQQIVALPDSLAVSADYGLTVMLTASSAAWRFAFFILSNDGQRILANRGFAAPGMLH
jgi:molybdate transport system substrate-binding protein